MYDPTGNFQIHIQRFSGLQQVQYTVGLLNLISFRFPNLKLNLDSTFYPATGMTKVSKEAKLQGKFEPV
jgi:hypothetical protein